MATTPVDPRVANKLNEFLTLDGEFGNPASTTHYYGKKAREAVEEARSQVANLINADAKEIIWTSGATESDNLAIKGAAYYYQDKGKHIITTKTEHKAVLDTCIQLEREGFEVTYLTPEKSGLFTIEQVNDAIREDTILVSIMHVNNEIGVVQDLRAIGELTRSKGILLHTDAAQSAGKVAMDVTTMPVDMISFSGHKVYGPKGIGALYVRRKPRVRLCPQIHGGGHEQGLRSGTLATHQIAAMGEAFAVAATDIDKDEAHISGLRDRFINGLQPLGYYQINGDLAQRIPGNLNICFQQIDGEALVMGLQELAVSTGSACNSATTASSHVLKAIGLSDEMAQSSLRISFGRFTTEQDVDHAVGAIVREVQRLREISPLWQAGEPQSFE
jgi:cysteine desulfurase